MLTKYLEAELKRLNRSRSSLAAEAGVDKSTITRLFNGGSLTPEMTAKLVSVGFDLDELLNAELEDKKAKVKELMGS